jgi:ketosteroid isomerase-like protein
MDEQAIQRLIDRQAIEDTLYKYAATIDLKDYDGLRTVFTDDVVAQYAGAPEIQGADTLVSWIREMSQSQGFQHHFVNVYEVDIDGDEAKTYTYHTSHQIDPSEPDTVYVIVGRYRNVLHKVDGRWLIADKRMEVGWMEKREYSQAVAVAAESEQNLGAQSRSGVDA